MSSFSEKLRLLRREKGWSQDVFAKKIGVHGRHVGKYEIGQAMPNSNTLIKIAKVFGVSTDYLLLEEPTTVQGTKIKDKDLLKSFEKADQMGDNDKELIKIFIDAFIKKRQVEKVMQD